MNPSRQVRARHLAAPKPGVSWWFTSIDTTSFDGPATKQTVQQVAFGHPIRPQPPAYTAEDAPGGLLGIVGHRLATVGTVGTIAAFGVSMLLFANRSTAAGRMALVASLIFLATEGIGLLIAWRAKTAIPHTPQAEQRIATNIHWEVDLEDHLAKRGRRNQWTPVDVAANDIHRELAVLTDWQRLHDQGVLTDHEWDAIIAQAYALRTNTASALMLPKTPTVGGRQSPLDRYAADLQQQLAQYRDLSDRISEAVKQRATAELPAALTKTAEPAGILSATPYDNLTTWETPSWEPVEQDASGLR